MSTLEVSPAETLPDQSTHRVVNDFSIQVATVNGSGSQTANTVLMRSIFQMGIPVSGKNMFPSNIAGLPTWFTIRASKTRLYRRRKEIDILVAMNPETAREDVMKLDPAPPSSTTSRSSSTICAATCTSTRCRSTSWSPRSVPRPSCASWCAT